jgi:DNA repair exonuclease SbcCD ATPase subunit
MTNTKTLRSEELRAALEAAQRDLSTARDAIGEAIADSNEDAASELRSEVARLERLQGELNAARSIALRREREAEQAEREAQRRAAEREANKNRAKRIAAAKKVDAALATLAKAYSDYLATAPGGRPEDRNRLARRSQHAIAAATFTAAPEFAEAMEPHRRPPRMHWQPLAKSVEGTIGEFAEVEPEAEAEPA